MTMNEITKRQILSTIASIPTDQLLGFIERGEIALGEMLAHGLPQDKQRALRDSLAVSEQQREVDRANRERECERNARVNELLSAIEQGGHNVSQIQTYIREGLITENDLLGIRGITPQLAHAISGYSKRDTQFSSWRNLPPLQSGRTDLYFLGLPGSGKTCILASLFRYMHKEGLIDTAGDHYSPEGAKYRNQLREEFSNGILPHTTQMEVLTGDTREYVMNYIPMGLRNIDRASLHPLNLLDMSGEMINQTYQDHSGQGTIFTRDYLTNSNRKLIFFVIDYAEHETAQRAVDGDQASKLEYLLTLLDAQGILNLTDGLYILVSKADQFPPGVDPGTFAKEFLDNNYKNFIRSCQSMRDKHRGQFRITGYPYTVGAVRFQDLVVSYNERSPSFICDRILHHAFQAKKGALNKIGLQ